jgi:hypothetical protein
MSLCPKTMRISYSANFAAQIPKSIAGRIGEDFRVVPDSVMLIHLLLLGQFLSAAAEKYRVFTQTVNFRCVKLSPCLLCAL